MRTDIGLPGRGGDGSPEVQFRRTVSGAGGRGEMAQATESSAPGWMPSSVGAAYRRGGADTGDLISGASYRAMLDALARAGSVLTTSRVPSSEVDQASGYRHLLVLLALGIDEALRASNPYEPHITAANVDSVLKWGMDCPDAAYSGTPVRADAVYRLSGHRGTARYVGFQVMAGMASTANVVLDDLDIDADGSFELILSTEPHRGNWMELSEGASSFVVRQFFYDWADEEPARLEIECLESARAPDGAERLSAAGVARQLEALGELVETGLEFWLGIEESGRAQGTNMFREPVNKTAMGAAAESVTVWGSWELEQRDALLIEVSPPDALYWSVALGNHWWETIDYAAHQSSLNGFQAVVDEDGMFRAVVAHSDPGVANWLDTAGHRQGPAIFRWVRADGAPVPQTRVVQLDEVRDVLPPDTATTDPEARAKTIAERRAGVRRRFAR
ncbi:MAG: DUF1214 domain-containing protein [Acidimicrobiales bacterium]